MLKTVGIIAAVVLFVVVATFAGIPSGWIMIAVGGFVLWNRLRTSRADPGSAPSDG
jgi:hypothetical protein